MTYSPDDDLTAARQRIAAAYDPLLLQDAGHRLADLLAAHLARAEAVESAPCCPGWSRPRASARRRATCADRRRPRGVRGRNWRTTSPSSSR